MPDGRIINENELPVIISSRQFVGSKNFEAAKHELAKAEYLHELTERLELSLSLVRPLSVHLVQADERYEWSCHDAGRR